MVAKVRCKRPKKDANGNPCDCGRYLGEVEGKFSLLCLFAIGLQLEIPTFRKKHGFPYQSLRTE